MASVVILTILAASLAAQTKPSADETAVRNLFEEQRVAILHGDTKKLEQLFADDYVVTNPFNQFLNKKQVIERTASGEISMESFERTLEYVKLYGDFAVVAGTETGVWGAKAKLAGKPIHLRMTAVARKVDGQWVEVARHASVILAGPAPVPSKQ